MRKFVNVNELFPYYSLEDRTFVGMWWRPPIELTEQEYADFLRVQQEWMSWQEKLRAPYDQGAQPTEEDKAEYERWRKRVSEGSDAKVEGQRPD